MKHTLCPSPVHDISAVSATNCPASKAMTLRPGVAQCPQRFTSPDHGTRYRLLGVNGVRHAIFLLQFFK